MKEQKTTENETPDIPTGFGTITRADSDFIIENAQPWPSDFVLGETPEECPEILGQKSTGNILTPAETAELLFSEF